MISQNVDINAIKMKEKLDFGQTNGLRRENKPLANMTPLEEMNKRKMQLMGEHKMDTFLKRRAVMHERAPVVP